jgi:hypothetical protein
MDAKQDRTNIERLQKAGIVTPDYVFSEPDLKVIEGLSRDEVDALITIGDKLGPEFLQKHGGGPTAGILF